MYTSVPVRRADPGNHEREGLVVLLSFLVGILLGSLGVLAQNGRLPFPESPSSQLGAVAGSIPDTKNESGEIPANEDGPSVSTTEVEANEPVSTEVVSIPPAQVAEENPALRTLELEIVDKRIAVERVNQEIERVKNASVSVISEFTKNCGSWSDPCALPYSKRLEESNKTYAELVPVLESLNRSLESLVIERSRLGN